MIGVGSRSQRIERIPGASLAVTRSTGGEAADPAIRRIGIASYAAQVLGMSAAVVTALLTTGAAQVVAVLIAIALCGPLLIECTALVINMIVRPGQLTLNHRRKQLAKDGQVVLILTSYVRDPAAPKGTAKKLLTGLQRQWRAEKIIVIGYPANRPLQRLCRDLGAIGDGRRGRRMKFHYSAT
jgi:hypothetical protein